VFKISRFTFSIALEIIEMLIKSHFSLTQGNDPDERSSISSGLSQSSSLLDVSDESTHKLPSGGRFSLKQWTVLVVKGNLNYKT